MKVERFDEVTVKIDGEEYIKISYMLDFIREKVYSIKVCAKIVFALYNELNNRSIYRQNQSEEKVEK